jgi:dihydroflavonol-4-reductase
MILVTGATGFLGAELAMQLAQRGETIRCTKRATSVIPQILHPYQQVINWVEADLMDLFALEAALEGVSQVYHCAALVSFKQADKDPMIKTNITGTANIVNLCAALGIRLLHVSSVAALGQAKPGQLINEKNYLEETPANNIYAVSKLESEMEVWRGIAEGLNAVIVNPSIIVGPNAGINGSGQIFETVRKGLKFYTTGSCGFVDVQDVARCMIALMNTDIQAERYIINAENRSYKQLFAEIAQCFGVKPPASQAKPWMLSLAWRGAALWAAITGTAPSLDKIAAKSAPVVQDYDNRKIRQAISVEFKPISSTISEVCAALKQ